MVVLLFNKQLREISCGVKKNNSANKFVAVVVKSEAYSDPVG